MKRIITIFCLLVLFLNQGFSQMKDLQGKGTSRSMGVAKIHLVFIGDTKDPDEGIGPAVKNNEKLYINVFTDIANALHVKLQTTIVDGDNYNKVKIQNTINNITPQDNIPTFVIVDGHGFWATGETDSEHGRILGSIGNSLRSSDEKTFHVEKDIFKPIHERNPSAFLIVIGEYCQVPISGYHFKSLGISDFIFKKEYLSKLFHSQISAVYSTSSHGQESWTLNNYGIGLYYFLYGLQKVVNESNPSWEKVFEEAKDLTQNKSKAIKKTMTPVYTIYKKGKAKDTGVVKSWGFNNYKY